jgi:hypothetical protein
MNLPDSSLNGLKVLILRRNADKLIIAATLVLAALGLYARTLAPDVVDADGGEFQFAAWNFSFVHPTGYPLYLILGGLFQHLVPIGNPAYRLNLFTAITAALAVGVLYFVVHSFTGQRIAAGIAAGSFAVTRTFWYDANAAETYDLNALFLGLLMLLALRWQGKPRAQTFAVFAFVYGLALTHHRTIILWVPAFALFFLLIAHSRRVISPSRHPTSHPFRFAYYALLISLFVLAPLLLYLYIPLRAPLSPYAALDVGPNRSIVLYDNSLTGFVNYVLGRVFQAELGWDAVSAARLVRVPQALLDQFGVVGALTGIAGLGVMVWRRQWERLTLLLVGLTAVVIFASMYHIGDIFHYYIPVYFVWAIWIGVAIAAILQWIEFQPSYHRLSSAFAVVCLLCLVALPMVYNFAASDRSGETQARQQWSSILNSSLPPNAILISNDRDEMMPLWYIQYVENTRRDVLGLFPFITSAAQFANISNLTDSVLDVGRPVFLIKPMPGMEIKYNLSPSSPPLVRVLGSAGDAPPMYPSEAMLAGKVRILGYDWALGSHRLRATIYWQARAKLDEDYVTFVHLFNSHGEKVAQGDDHKVGGDFYPTSLWGIGENLRDEQAITLPSNLAPGLYRLVAGMYRQSDFEPLGDPVEIGAIEIK